MKANKPGQREGILPRHSHQKGEAPGRKKIRAGNGRRKKRSFCRKSWIETAG
jgi:hypothetical protein